MTAIVVEHLTKVYPATGVTANDDISFQVEPGSAFGLLGSNGAGKSTLVRQLVGLASPTHGRIEVMGHHVAVTRRGDPSVARNVAYLPQGLPALGELTVAEAIKWTATIRGDATAPADELCERLGLTEARSQQLRRLSGGQRRLTQIAMTLAGDLPILILDEPTADIDPRLKHVIWDMVSERVATGACVVLVTHDVAEAEHVLDQVAILDHGKVVAEGSPAELKARLADRTRVGLVVREDATTTPKEVARALGPGAVVNERRVEAWVAAVDAVRVLDGLIAAFGLTEFEDVHLVTPTLEDVYMEVGGPRVPVG